jgi:HPt (histidine-containing phosphotransfer) domain-containing protein
MIIDRAGKVITNVCDLKYLTEMMGGKKHLIKRILDAFLIQIPEELNSINDAIIKINYPSIKSFAHTMKSSVSIMGISMLTPVLQEMEVLALAAVNIEKLKELNQELILICHLAIEEVETAKHGYQ